MEPRNMNMLLVTGGEQHDFTALADRLKHLANGQGWNVTATQDRAALAQLSAGAFATVVLCAQGGELTASQERGLVDFVQGGGGFVGIHGAATIGPSHTGYQALLGCRFVGHGPPVELDIEPADPDHFITRHVRRFRAPTELYQLEMTVHDEHLLLQSVWQGKIQPVAYVRHQGRGRVVYLSLGHTVEDFQDGPWLTVLLRAWRWAAGATEKPPLKAGVIGYGGAFNMGKHHLTEMKNAGLIPVAACDIDPVRMKAAAADFPALQTYTNIGALLAKSEAELLTVILPHNVHASVATQVLASGRHCVVEKPMAITSAEVQTMIAAAEKHQRLLSAYHNRRWDGDFLAIEHVVRRRQLLGDLFQVEMAMSHYGAPGNWWRSHKDISGGIQYDWGAHFMYWALELIDGPIDWVVATAQKRVWRQASNEDHLSAYVRFRSGCILQFETSSIARAPKPRWRILGTRGAIVDTWNGAFDLAIYEPGVHHETPARVKYYETQWGRYYENIADHLGLGDPLEITARKAGRVIHLLYAMDQAAASGRQERVSGEG